MQISRFNIRVYMLLLDETGSNVLLSDEILTGEDFTKFPGGGVEYGEGILDCLHREAQEELGQDIEVVRQLYTTETFQNSLFKPDDQIVCVYYHCRLPVNKDGRRLPSFQVSERKYDFADRQEREQRFRWKPIGHLKTDDLSLPLDQQVVPILKNLIADE
jgi:ADP-ribose pyrophosphatase YjhB (NUDIX family)